MIDLDGWRARANGGESQYALAVGLLAIAEAINAHATKELEAVARLMEHDRMRAMTAQQEAERENEPPRRWWSLG